MNKVLRPQNLKLALVADSGLGIGSVFPLTSERHVLGRTMDAAIPVEDTKVSREHALIDQRNGFLYLVDLGSTNGTYLNGRRVNQAERLSLGDHVRVGSTVFKVQLLKRLQSQAPTNWHELTRIDRVPAPLPAAPSPSLPPTRIPQSTGLSEALATGPRWMNLVENSPTTSKLSRRQSRVLLAATCAVLVLLAIFSGLT